MILGQKKSVICTISKICVWKDYPAREVALLLMGSKIQRKNLTA
jgi:hypothetical protein